MLKDNLRQPMRKARADFVRTMNKSQVEALFAQFFLGLLDLKGIHPPAPIALYHALPQEAPTGALIAALQNRGYTTLLPRIQRSLLPQGPDDMNFYAFKAGAMLKGGPFGIQEPQTPLPFRAVPAVVVLPCLAFNNQGHRLGYGKGHYDRTLGPLKQMADSPYLVGLAFACQETDLSFGQSHDVHLDAIVTEQGLKFFI